MEHTTTKPAITPFEQAIDNAVQTGRLNHTMIVCRACAGTGVGFAVYDRETGRYDADDCTRCYGYGEHIR